MNHVSKIIIIIIIIIIKEKKLYKSQTGGRIRRGTERGRTKEIFYLFLLFLIFVSFSDLRKSDRRFSSRLKAKLIYATRVTRGHQNLGVSSNSTR